MTGMIRAQSCLEKLASGRAMVQKTVIILSVGLAMSACVAPKAPETPVVSSIPETGSGIRPTDLPFSQIETLRNLSASAVLARLGPPDFTRQDPPAEFWQYRGATCVLDLFLYPDAGTLKVNHTQTRGRHGAEAVGLSDNPCSPFSPETTASTS